LPATQTELRLVFKEPPRLGFGLWGDRMAEPDQLVVRMDPATGVRFMLDARRATSMSPEAITLDMTFAQEGGEGATPYEVLLHAAMVGATNRFMRQDSVEETWRIMQPLLDAAPDVQSYQPGSWGPAAANNLVAGYGGWQEPWTID
jgi:glucose-6-phosphate 1-dehydrogenase